MWHAAIWEYIGQTINMYCDWVESAEKASFASATKPETLQNLEQARLGPIPKDKIEKLARDLRSIWGSTDASRKIRNIGTHKYHIANTYTSEFEILINMKTGMSHPERLRRFQKKSYKIFRRSYKSSEKVDRIFRRQLGSRMESNLVSIEKTLERNVSS